MFSQAEKASLIKAFDIYNADFFNSLPPHDKLTGIVFSKKFEKRMNKLLFHGPRFYYSLINTVGKRVACIILTVLLTASLATVSVEALRKRVFNFISEIFDTYTVFDYTGKKSDIPLGEYTVFTPQYIPEGFEETNREEDLMGIFIKYENKQGEKIVFSQDILADAITINIDNETDTHEYIDINGYEALCYPSEDEFCIIFHTDDYMFELSGQCSKNELIKIADSIF